MGFEARERQAPWESPGSLATPSPVSSPQNGSCGRNVSPARPSAAAPITLPVSLQQLKAGARQSLRGLFLSRRSHVPAVKCSVEEAVSAKQNQGEFSISQSNFASLFANCRLALTAPSQPGRINDSVPVRRIQPSQHTHAGNGSVSFL